MRASFNAVFRMSLLASAAALAFGAAAARADEAGPQTGDTATVGVGMICNTSEQAERYVALRAGGAEIEQAMHAVNAEVKDPRACGVAAIAFIPDKTMSSHPAGGKLLQVVRVNIVAGYNGAGWQAVNGMVQYAVLQAEGQTI